jgi:hypothetical protein
MSLIRNLIVTDKISEVEFPDLEGFKVSICYLGRDRLLKIRNGALEYKFNKRTRQREEEVNNEKFLEAYTEAVVKGWKGLTYKNLSKLIPIELSKVRNPNEEIPYSSEDALDLIKNSTIFDQFITDTLNNFDNFEQEAKAAEEKN